MKELILAIGMQRSYLDPKGSKYLGEHAEVYEKRIKSFLISAKKEGSAIRIIREVHAPDDSFYSEEKTNSMIGSLDIQIPEFYRAYSSINYSAMRYNALYRTPLESEIHKINPELITLIGFETHTFILFTAEELRNRNYPVRVIEPLVASRDDYLHAIGITLMRNFLSVEIS